ncbi:PTS lactose/cellobiose transporter subunit IIA [Spiroplasma citri]|uniref:PTS lactose/cellobiose transporter subunit IIA n=1 Tax=Spiroplasma citri TaxID=2133 RepID=A0AAX3SXK8_SPICI|nr:PTS lactose/cellobiose transporter subunit IIA [Spiroplasma citri]WFG95862.1 PTS lactose/cellobiose transporter subunit IIA [Spiroplasma citri]
MQSVWNLYYEFMTIIFGVNHPAILDIVARELINEAHQELTKVHKFHAELIQHEANGEQYPMTVLVVHAQDHFNSAIIILDLAEHLICLYERTGKES